MKCLSSGWTLHGLRELDGLQVIQQPGVASRPWQENHGDMKIMDYGLEYGIWNMDWNMEYGLEYYDFLMG